MKIIVLIVLIVVVIATIYIICKKKQEKNKIVLSPENTSTTTVEGELPFADVVSYFKTLNLNKKEDVPFICRGSERVKDLFNVYQPKFELVGYIWLFIGVYNEAKEEITEYKVIYAKEFDAKLKETFGDEDFVILS